MPLGIRTMVSQVQSVSKSIIPNNSCIISTTIFHMVGSWFSSYFAAASQIFKCSYRIPDGPLYQFGRTHIRDQFTPHPGPRPSRQPDLTLRLWGHLVYYYRHHNSHYWHHNPPKRYFRVIMYNQTRKKYFIKM